MFRHHPLPFLLYRYASLLLLLVGPHPPRRSLPHPPYRPLPHHRLRPLLHESHHDYDKSIVYWWWIHHSVWVGVRYHPDTALRPPNGRKRWVWWRWYSLMRFPPLLTLLLATVILAPWPLPWLWPWRLQYVDVIHFVFPIRPRLALVLSVVEYESPLVFLRLLFVFALAVVPPPLRRRSVSLHSSVVVIIPILHVPFVSSVVAVAFGVASRPHLPPPVDAVVLRPPLPTRLPLPWRPPSVASRSDGPILPRSDDWPRRRPQSPIVCAIIVVPSIRHVRPFSSPSPLRPYAWFLPISDSHVSNVESVATIFPSHNHTLFPSRVLPMWVYHTLWISWPMMMMVPAIV